MLSPGTGESARPRRPLFDVVFAVGVGPLSDETDRAGAGTLIAGTLAKVASVCAGGADGGLDGLVDAGAAARFCLSSPSSVRMRCSIASSFLSSSSFVLAAGADDRSSMASAAPPLIAMREAVVSVIDAVDIRRARQRRRKDMVSPVVHSPAIKKRRCA